MDRMTWDELNASRRASIRRAAIAAAVARLAGHSHYPGDVQEAPAFVPFAARREDRRISVHVILSHVLYCRTISGSDWVEHFIFTALVISEPPHAPTLTFEEEQRIGVSEAEFEHYRPQASIDAAVARALARLDGRPPPPAADEAERARRLVEAARRRPPAPTTERRTVVRCPKCGSTDASAAELYFEFTEMRCGACGFHEMVDDYEIGDRWNLRLELPVGAPMPARVAPHDGDS